MIYTGEISLRTQGNGDIIDITAKVQKHLTDSSIANGIVYRICHSFHSWDNYGRIRTRFSRGFRKVVGEDCPKKRPICARCALGRRQRLCHVRASLLGASLVIPFTERKWSWAPGSKLL